MKLLSVISLLVISGCVMAQTDISKIKCTTCRCYQLKCSRLETYDPTCQDEFRETCDNNEDITEENFCNTQCDCCLQTQCFTWQDYPCMIFRTYEFSNIVYFILITVNAFILTRLYRAMFSREEERKIDDPDEEEEEKRLKTASEVISVKFMGRLAIKKDLRALKRLTEPVANDISDFFDEVEKHKGVATKNQIILASLCLLYLLLNAFHAINIFVMSNVPLTYVYVIWLQHLMLIAFWVACALVFKKVTLYIKKVRETIKQFEENYEKKSGKKLKITIQSKGNLMDFNFGMDN